MNYLIKNIFYKFVTLLAQPFPKVDLAQPFPKVDLAPPFLKVEFIDDSSCQTK